MTSIQDRPDLASAFIRDAHKRMNVRAHAPEKHSAGITSLINCLYRSWLRRAGELGEDDLDEDFLLTTMIGTAYHGFLPPSEWHTEVPLRYHAYDLDEGGNPVYIGDITGFADGLKLEARDSEVIEVACELKTTRSSAGHQPNDLYIEQLATVAYLSDRRTGQLFEVHLNGNYKPPKPSMRVTEYQFSDGELDRWMVEMKRRLGLLLDTENPPPMEEHRDFECKNCAARAKGLCPGGPGVWGHTPWFGPSIMDLVVDGGSD